MDQRDGNRLGLDLVPPILVGLLLLLSVVGLFQAMSSIAGWSSNYSSEGMFDNDFCTSEQLRVTSRVSCDGLVTPEADPQALPATMVGPHAAFGKNPPVGGEQVPVYYRSGNTSEVYPLEGRTTELIRMLLGRFDSFFLTFGAAAWMLGWYLTRDVSSVDSEFRQYRYRFPQRFRLRSMGIKWMMVGVAWWLFDRLLLNDILGTVGLG